jgi:hypothetical protein
MGQLESAKEDIKNLPGWVFASQDVLAGLA